MSEETVKPQPPKINPLGARPSTLKLKPVIRPPMSGGASGLKLPAKPAAPAAPAADAAPAAPVPTPTPAAVEQAKSATASLEQLKTVTQTLKSVTAQIPAQAILHKTGIIADPGLTESQMAAAKARTSRISLSDAMGVAPVKNEAAPMKTIRIKRPVDLPGAAPAAAPAAAAPAEATPAASSSANITQRKTLKISRPGSAVRPAGKFGAKKAADSQAETVVRKTEDEVADIADIPEMPAAAAAAPMAPLAGNRNVEKDVPKGVAITSLIIQIAACLTMGFLAYKFYIDLYETSPF